MLLQSKDGAGGSALSDRRADSEKGQRNQGEEPGRCYSAFKIARYFSAEQLGHVQPKSRNDVMAIKDIGFSKGLN